MKNGPAPRSLIFSSLAIVGIVSAAVYYFVEIRPRNAADAPHWPQGSAASALSAPPPQSVGPEEPYEVARLRERIEAAAGKTYVEQFVASGDGEHRELSLVIRTRHDCSSTNQVATVLMALAKAPEPWRRVAISSRKTSMTGGVDSPQLLGAWTRSSLEKIGDLLAIIP